MTDSAMFRAYVESLPAGTAVPVPREQLLAMMDPSASSNGSGEGGADMTVAQVAARFGRSASTVRGWILAGKITAYKFSGHELRVTRASLADFEAAQRAGVGRPTPGRAGKAVDMTAYRRAS